MTDLFFWRYLVEEIPTAARDFDEVWDVFIVNSKIYFCTFRRIYIYDGQTISIVEHKDGFNKSFYVNGKIFTQSQLGNFFEIKDLSLIPILQKKQNPLIIASIIPQDGGYLLFYNSGEIEFSSPFGINEKYNDLIKRLQGKYVNHVLQLSDTRLVIATQTSGLFLYDIQNKTLENITTEDGLPTNACLRIFQDFTGNLWVGTQNGIVLVDINSPMRFSNQEIDIQGSGYDVFEAEEGTYYTTSNGIYFLAKNTAKSVFLEGTEGPAYGMQKIIGRLYAGHHTGLFQLENGVAKQLAKTDGLWQIKHLRSRPEFAIAGTYSGLYLFKIGEDKVVQPVQKINGFNESSRFFEEDQQGRIWVSQFYKGLYQLDLTSTLIETRVNKISDTTGIPINEQIILSNIDNELYLGTQKGIYQLNQTTNQVVKAEMFTKAIGEQPIYLLVQDNQKNIHVIADNLVGFFKQISAKNYVFVPSSLYQLRYYFNNDLLNVSVNIHDGVWFNANEGFIHYRPELENRIEIEKPLLISKIYSIAEDSILYARKPFESDSDIVQPLIVSHRARVLQFLVESFQYNEMDNQQFRYFLKGFDDAFGEWTNTAVKEYTNLKEGDYEFIFQTRNYLGEIVTSQSLALKVEPPFYKTLFAKILYFLLGSLILFQILRFQKRRYKQKTKQIEAHKQQELAKNQQMLIKIEQQKQQELAKKQQMLVEIEQQKEQELLQLKEEKMQSELQHLKNLLAASTMNLVVKNEFIETIKENLKEVKLKRKNTETRKALEKIEKKIDSTLRIQEDWKQFEHHFNQVHGDFLARLREAYLDLSPNEQKLCAFLRLNLNTKDIANLMGISLRGVEIARYRLRKKLTLQKGQNLSKFILEY